MPRTNPGRTTDAEARLARRIEYEREKAGLSYQALAKQVTGVGCRIQATAIHKIEKGDQKTGRLRRITVNELAAFAEVFTGGDVTDLLRSVDEVELERAGELLAQLRGRNRELYELVSAMFNDFVDLAVAWKSDEDIYEFVMGHFSQDPLGHEVAERQSESESNDVEASDGAYDALVFLLSDIAARTWHTVSQITLMYMNTLASRERGEGPSDEELKAWVQAWVAKRESGSGMPAYPEARERLAARVEEWLERIRS